MAIQTSIKRKEDRKHRRAAKVNHAYNNMARQLQDAKARILELEGKPPQQTELKKYAEESQVARLKTMLHKQDKIITRQKELIALKDKLLSVNAKEYAEMQRDADKDFHRKLGMVNSKLLSQRQANLAVLAGAAIVVIISLLNHFG